MNIKMYIFNICKIFVIILQTQKRIILVRAWYYLKKWSSVSSSKGFIQWVKYLESENMSSFIIIQFTTGIKLIVCTGRYQLLCYSGKTLHIPPGH